MSGCHLPHRISVTLRGEPFRSHPSIRLNLRIEHVRSMQITSRWHARQPRQNLMLSVLALPQSPRLELSLVAIGATFRELDLA